MKTATEKMVGALLEREPSIFDSWQGRVVALYRPMAGEPDCGVLDGVLRALGATLAYPRVIGPLQQDMEFRAADPSQPSQWESDALGFASPRADQPEVKPHQLELICVPGQAFDRRGGRLGRGRGHYDRFLQRAPEAWRVALAFEEDLIPEVPTEEHDQAIQVIFTEQGAIECLNSTEVSA